MMRGNGELGSMFRGLDARRKIVLGLRLAGSTQREVAQRLGISAGRVSQLARDAGRKVRQAVLAEAAACAEPEPVSDPVDARSPANAVWWAGGEFPKARACEVALDDLMFTMRTTNCLKLGGMETLAALLDRSESDLLGLWAFGNKSLTEVRDQLSARGLALREGQEEMNAGERSA